MKKTIIMKAFYQFLIGIALSFIYMQIRPNEIYTLAWPFAFLAAWFLLWAWIAYLRYDRLSVFDVTDRYKKQIDAENTTSFTLPGFLRYVNTPIRFVFSEPDVTAADRLKIRMSSNFICFVLFGILSFIF